MSKERGELFETVTINASLALFYRADMLHYEEEEGGARTERKIDVASPLSQAEGSDTAEGLTQRTGKPERRR